MPEMEADEDDSPEIEEKIEAEMAEVEEVAEVEEEDVEAEDDDEWVEDDPSGNLQLYTPSSMLSWGQFDVKFFQQIYSQTAFFDPDGNSVDHGARYTYYSGIGNVVLGVNQRWNFGVDFWVQSVLFDPDSGSPFKVLGFPNAGPNARTALTAVGPKVKFQPISSLNNFTIQSSFLIPVASDPEARMNGEQFLATENFLWWTQVFYTHNFNTKLQLFGEIDFYANLNRGDGNGFFATPISYFFSYFPTSKITLYVTNQFWPTWGDGLFSSYWFQAGVGGKYQFTKSLDLEVSYGRFLFGRNAAGPAQAFNLGLRFVKW
ncbi:MAG: hypothetical protein AAF570_16680 [Bacteroidota bacterium]